MQLVLPMATSTGGGGSSGTRMNINAALANAVTTAMYTVPAGKNFVTTNMTVGQGGGAPQMRYGYLNSVTTTDFSYFFDTTSAMSGAGTAGIIWTSGQTIYARTAGAAVYASISGVLYDN